MMTSFDDSLLVAVSQHPVLYNHCRSDYKNSEAKTKAWESIQRILQTTESVEKIRQRWKSIRDSYVKYLNKMKDRNGSKVRPYKFDKQLTFLKPFLTAQKDGNLRFDSDETQIECADQLLLQVTTEDIAEDDQLSNCTNQSASKRKRSEGSYLFDNHISTQNLSTDYRMLQQMDDIEVFCFGLAQTMKKLRPLTVAKLKKEMSNLVTDVEIRELEEVEYLVPHAHENF